MAQRIMPGRALPLFLLIVATILGSSAGANTFGQTRCLSPDEVKRFTDQLESNSTRSLDQKLSEHLLKLEAREQERIQSNVADNKSGETILKTLRSSRQETSNELCAIVKQYGWPTRELVGDQGEEAAFFLLRNSASPDLQRDLLPVIIALTKKGEVRKAQFATYIDRLRTTAGLKQLFGTQATIKDGFLVLFPISDEAHVDALRKQYELPPVRVYVRGLEQLYRLPLIRATGALNNSFMDDSAASLAQATDKVATAAAEPDLDVVRVDTNLVNLNVSVYATQARTEVAKLEQKDFVVKEDGTAQDVTFFASTDVPFDLVLLLDLSGSTSGKRKLIQKSTEKFIAAARPTDRIAIVTFADDFSILSPLTVDRQELLAAARKIDGTGGSRVWDALAFTLDRVLDNATSPRRRAVVFMTDGADNALASWQFGSRIDFADLLELVRQHDSLIVPIYLDTEGGDSFSHRVYENARNTLKLLADESGGLYYKAKRIEDLNGVYGQVIEDLSKVYSIGYRSTNQKRDGSWRKVDIEISGHPELKTRARPGYYAH